MSDNKYLKAMKQVAEHVTAASPEKVQPVQPSEESDKPKKRKFGRPPGKRSNPDWEQLTVYIRRDTKKAALHRLVEDNGRGARDLSEVIEQLVAKWAKIV